MNDSKSKSKSKSQYKNSVNFTNSPSKKDHNLTNTQSEKADNDEDINKCQKCDEEFNEDNPALTLPCDHPICKKCLEQILDSDNNDDKIYQCKFCGKENDLNDLHIDNFKIFNFDGEDQTDIEYCNIHQNKAIEYFCEKCTKVVCVSCIYNSHNGHKLTTLFEKTNVIRHNIKDFYKVLNNVAVANFDNQQIVSQRFEEINVLRATQLKIVDNSFKDLFNALDEKKKEFIKEFNEKYSLEEKRFNKLMTLMKNTSQEILTIVETNEKLLKFSEIDNEAKILKEIHIFTNFLQKSYSSLKRIYKGELALKTEMKLNPTMNTVNINTKNLMQIIERIDPKVICYFNEMYDQNNKNHGYVFGYNGNNMNVNDNKANLLYDRNDNKKANPNIPKYKKLLLDDSSSNINLGTSNLQSNRYGNKLKFDNIAENFKNLKNNLVLMDVSGKNDETSKTEEDIKIKKMDVAFPLIKNKYEMNNANEEKIKYRRVNSFNKKEEKIFDVSSRGESVKSVRTFQSLKRSLNHQPKPYNIGKVNQNTYLETDFDYNKIEANENVKFNPSFVCLSDNNFGLMLNFNNKNNNINESWKLLKFDGMSHFKGGISYASIISIKKNRIILSGGVNDDGYPLDDCYEINTLNFNHNMKLKPMTHKRWAHSTIFINPFIYIIGGYEHPNIVKNNQSTLKYCERMNIETLKFEGIASLNQARAFFGIANVNENLIFVFGGLNNNDLIYSIEKYDIRMNVWITFHLKLMNCIAKMGVINYKNNIILLGGIDEQFKVTNKCVVLDINLGNFKKLPEMKNPRVFSNSAIMYEADIIVVGGDSECSCEKFDLIEYKWKSFESYYNYLPERYINKELYNWAFCTNYP